MPNLWRVLICWMIRCIALGQDNTKWIAWLNKVTLCKRVERSLSKATLESWSPKCNPLRKASHLSWRKIYNHSTGESTDPLTYMMTRFQNEMRKKTGKAVMLIHHLELTIKIIWLLKVGLVLWGNLDHIQKQPTSAPSTKGLFLSQ